jgi:hypothetical protein
MIIKSFSIIYTTQDSQKDVPYTYGIGRKEMELL